METQVESNTAPSNDRSALTARVCLACDEAIKRHNIEVVVATLEDSTTVFGGPMLGGVAAPVFVDEHAAEILEKNIAAWVDGLARDGVVRLHVQPGHPRVTFARNGVAALALWIVHARAERAA